MMMNSLSGTFRTTSLEQSAMVRCRSELKLSVNQIAKVLRRSSNTVHKYVKAIARDNRRLSPSMRRHLNACFQRNVKNLSFRLKMYLEGFAGFEDVIQSKSVPMVTLDWFLASENYTGEEDEDPA